MSSPAPRIVIIGAGIGGLTLALLLRRRGIILRFRGLVPIERLPRLPDPGALQFWMGPGAHLLHYPIADGSVINFLAVVEGPRQWTAPAWMAGAEPGAHVEAFAGWHPAVTR